VDGEVSSRRKTEANKVVSFWGLRDAEMKGGGEAGVRDGKPSLLSAQSVENNKWEPGFPQGKPKGGKHPGFMSKW